MLTDKEKENALRKIWCNAVDIQGAIEMGDLHVVVGMAEEIEMIAIKMTGEYDKVVRK